MSFQSWKRGNIVLGTGLRILENERQTAPKSSYPKNSFVMYVCLPVGMEQPGSFWKDLREILYGGGGLLKSGEKIDIGLKSNKALYMRT